MTFASIGDCCIDIYPDKKVLGGTSYNSAIVARKYGADVSLVSAIGTDDNARLYQKALEEQQIDISHLQTVQTQTSTVDITLDTHNSPVFGPWNLGALEKWYLTLSDLDYIKEQDVAKAMCLKPLEKNFSTFCSTPMPNTLKVGDFDGDSQYSFSPNEILPFVDGLDIIVKSWDADDRENLALLQHLADEKNKLVLVTLGSKGSMCFANGKTYRQDAMKIEVTNTTGFGDAYIAVFLITYFKTRDIQQSMQDATKAIAQLPQN